MCLYCFKISFFSKTYRKIRFDPWIAVQLVGWIAALGLLLFNQVSVRMRMDSLSFRSSTLCPSERTTARKLLGSRAFWGEEASPAFTPARSPPRLPLSFFNAGRMVSSGAPSSQLSCFTHFCQMSGGCAICWHRALRLALRHLDESVMVPALISIGNW